MAQGGGWSTCDSSWEGLEKAGAPKEHCCWEFTWSSGNGGWERLLTLWSNILASYLISLSFKFLIYKIKIIISLLQEWYERKIRALSTQNTRGPISCTLGNSILYVGFFLGAISHLYCKMAPVSSAALSKGFHFHPLVRGSSLPLSVLRLVFKIQYCTQTLCFWSICSMKNCETQKYLLPARHPFLH